MLDTIARLRRFNRAVTREIGALDTSFLGRGRPLGVARVLSMIPRKAGDIAAIRAELDLDSGLMSRALRSLEAEGLITVDSNPLDGRRRIASLTTKGAEEIAVYDQLNDSRAARILANANRTEELLAAVDLIANALNRNHVDIKPSDPEAPEAKACLACYFALLSQRIEGISISHVPDPDPEAAAYRAPLGAFLLAWSDDLPVGCVALKRVDAVTGEVKRLWVDAGARGLGIARTLMRAIEDVARNMGMQQLRLDSNTSLTAAIALYRADGWTETAPYTDPPANIWMAKRL